VGILNVCDERLAELERRKRVLSGRIAAQRVELEIACQQLRRPLHAFDTAKSVGGWLREHGPAVAAMLAPVLFLWRRPLAAGVGVAARLVQRATRWWALWKAGSRLFSMMPGLPKRKGYAR
jgi:hypothetical protein